VVLIPFHIAGATTLTTFTVGATRHLNSLDDGEYVRGPYGGPNLLRLSDGNLLLAGESDSFGGGKYDIFLVKLSPAFGIIWQTGYAGPNEEMVAYGLSESATDLQAAARTSRAGRNAAVFMQVSANGANSGEWLTRLTADFAVTDVSPDINPPPYTLVAGTMTVTDETCTLEDTTAALLLPRALYLPLVLRQ
jgi:hypothetical protein